MGTLLKIVSVFFKVGLLTIGGGLAMIPVMQQEMERLGWLSSKEFLDILGIAQMTPGAISVNTATFAGFRVMAQSCDGNLLLACVGAFAGTIAVCAPSLLCINIAGRIWSRYREHDCMVKVFSILRPLVTGLIITAASYLVLQSICGDVPLRECLGSISWFPVVVVAGAFLLTVCARMKPLYILGLGLLAGIGYGMI